jgi:hypothetical protein
MIDTQCRNCKAVYANQKLPTRCKICNVPMNMKEKEKIYDKSKLDS